MRPPPPDLVCLTTLPPSRWMGMRVWHPLSQLDGVPFWRPVDVPLPLRDPDADSGYAYDTGEIVAVLEDSPDDLRCRFRLSGGGTLTYGAYNLWVRRAWRSR